MVDPLLARCSECGAKLNLYVVGVCERCTFDLTGEDEERDRREERDRLTNSDDPGPV
jgi:predicted amidophosphoribosyltransferase